MLYQAPPTDFRPSSDTVALYLQYRGAILVVQRNPQKDSNPLKWGIPTGKVEAGETMEQAAIRELTEETGIAVALDRLHFLGTAYVRYPTSDFTFNQFLITFDREPQITLDQENVAFRWVGADEVGFLDLVEDQDEAFRQFFARHDL